MKESLFVEEIKNEGRKEASRHCILVALKSRFGEKATARVKDGVNGMEDLTQLDELFLLALHCREFEDFLEAVPEPSGIRSLRPSPNRS